MLVCWVIFANVIAAFCVNGAVIGNSSEPTTTSPLPPKLSTVRPTRRTTFEAITPCNENNGGCAHICNFDENTLKVVCSCKPGYKPTSRNKKKCRKILIRTCANNNGDCQQKCTDTVLGGVKCSCHDGYTLASDAKTCESMGCRYQNGGCEQKCEVFLTASWCTCHQGFKINSDQKTCKAIDACSNIHGCDTSVSRCINDPANINGYRCECYTGYELDTDQTTCIPMDWCAKNDRCIAPARCVNTRYDMGKCECPIGYSLNSDGLSCGDIDECQDGSNGGCSDTCVNFDGGSRCECPSGVKMHTDLRTCIVSYCPKLSSYRNGVYRCDSTQTRYNTGSQCNFNCKPGYTPSGTGDTVRLCQRDGSWSGKQEYCVDLNECKNDSQHNCFHQCHNIPGSYVCSCDRGYTLHKDGKSCKDAEVPSIKTCPSNIDILLEPGKNYSIATWELPTFTDNVGAKIVSGIIPPSKQLGVGYSFESYKIADDEGNTATCTFMIFVKDIEPPQVVSCPGNITVPLGINVEKETYVTWEEPKFSDNAGPVKVTNTVPFNNTFKGTGLHYVQYTAYDESGNAAKCSFTVTIAHKDCAELPKPANGSFDCSDWKLGTACHAQCNPGYEFFEVTEIPRYVCGGLGFWKPNNTIPDCYETITPISVKMRYTSKYKYECKNGDEFKGIVTGFIKDHFYREQTRHAMCMLDSATSSCSLALPINITCSKTEFDVSFTTDENLKHMEPSEIRYLVADYESGIKPVQDKDSHFFNIFYTPTFTFMSPEVQSRGMKVTAEVDFVCPHGYKENRNTCVKCPNGLCMNIKAHGTTLKPDLILRGDIE